jgi:hypothetical protein
VVVSARKEDEVKLVDELKKHGVKFSKLGFIKGKEMQVDGESLGTLRESRELYDNSLEELLK